MSELKWWQKAVVYQIYPKSFLDTTGSGTGDLVGITRKLDYLRALGVGAIWLTPIYESPMVDNGYDISDYKSIDPSYGTLDDFDELISEAKRRGIRIVMDLVFNHSSDRHRWFIESSSSRDNPKADWYIWRDAVDGKAPTNWRGIFGGSAWTWCEARRQYYLHTFASQQPDLNWENADVRRALYDSARFWLDRGVGGLRIDAITYIKKPTEFVDGAPDSSDGTVSVHSATANTPGILDFLHEFKREVFDGRDIFTVGEANGVAASELGDWVGSRGVFDMLFEFSHMILPFTDGEEVWCRPRRWKLTELKCALSASQRATALDGWYPIFFENHDQPRSINHFFPRGADPILGAKALATILLTLRGTPFIYQGQELGLSNVAWRSIDEYNDISSHGQYRLALEEGFTSEEAMEAVHFFSRDNARTPMQWSGELNAGFSTGDPWLPVHEDYARLNAAVESDDEGSVLNYFRRLVEFRRDNEALLSGDYEELLEDDERVYAFVRSTGGRRIYVLVNFTSEDVELRAECLNGKRLMLGNYGSIVGGKLRPLEAIVCEG